jgi:hypothetical protein
MQLMELFSCKSGEKLISSKLKTKNKQKCFLFSPKDIANLKNEIEKRQKEGSPEPTGREITEGASELPKDEALAKAPAAAAVQS